ncbi:MAG: MlaD family protein [Solirubrobacteraceae bacterium]
MSRPNRRREPTGMYPLLGAALLLILVVLVALSWNATNGLPGERVYRVAVEVPDANRMIRNNQVRIGGIRVGRVADVAAVVPDGEARPLSRLELKLSPDAGPLPRDSRVQIRSASILGATYVDIIPGRDRRTVPDGGTLPLANARDSVELTDLFDVFDRATSRNIQRSFVEVGDGLAGRGTDLGAGIAQLARLTPVLSRVTRTLADPGTRLGPLLGEYERFMAALDGAGGALGDMASGAHRTFAALADVRGSLARTLDGFPAAGRTAERMLRRLRPALDGLADVTAELEPASRRLPGAVDRLNVMLDSGVAPMRELPRFSRELERSLGAADAVGRLPGSVGLLRRLEEALGAVGEALDEIGPAQTACNFLGVFGTNFSGVIGGLRIRGGPSVANFRLRSLGIGAQEVLQNRDPDPSLHVNYLPRMNEDECESGNEPFAYGRSRVANPPGRQLGRTFTTRQEPRLRELARRAGLQDTPPPGDQP